ncbi:MAG TPA: NADH:flavin oxidoreductase/NADH oxidase [Candidatus Paceibacterota bacterium]|nr:NADH:flavin oxidoreductase/NADH oxidase [Candidatus Paceibacterota bacterium]
MPSSLFQKIKIRDLTIENRVWVSPMCQYSATNGIVGQWHEIHLGALATGGAGLIFVEATGVVPEGRISIGCPGIWSDKHAEAFRPAVEFAHSMNRTIGIQLAHAGRKGSTMRPWDDHLIADKSEGGWQTVSASPLAFHGMSAPRELSSYEISELTDAFVQGAKRAIEVGFDVIELHAAHGYLFHQFLSPLTNLRVDEYGGDFDDRTRFLREVTEKVRASIPTGVPLFVRISASDWVEGGWDIEQSISLSKELRKLGVDLIDVSSGGLVHDAKIPFGPNYQVPFAAAIKEKAEILTSAVGLITEAEQAQEIIDSGKADAVMLAREMLRNPRWPLNAAEQLGVHVGWPDQYRRASKFYR